MEHALFSSEQMTLAEALSMYTIEAAFAARAEEPTAAIGSSEYFCLWIKEGAKRRIYVDLCSDSVILKKHFFDAIGTLGWRGSENPKLLTSENMCAEFFNFLPGLVAGWLPPPTRKRSALEVWSLGKKQISSSFRARRMLRQCWKLGDVFLELRGFGAGGEASPPTQGGIYGSKWVMFNSDGLIFDWRHLWCQGED